MNGERNSIYILNMPTRLNNLLLSEEINTIDKLVCFNSKQLRQIPKIGIKYIKCIEESLLRFGYTLKSNGDI